MKLHASFKPPLEPKTTSVPEGTSNYVCGGCGARTVIAFTGYIYNLTCIYCLKELNIPGKVGRCESLIWETDNVSNLVALKCVTCDVSVHLNSDQHQVREAFLKEHALQKLLIQKELFDGTA